MKSRTMWMVAALVVLAAGLPTAASAQVNALPEHPHILVYGSATARAVPDRFRLTMTIRHTDPAAELARTRVAGLFDEIIEQLVDVGVPKAEIEGTSLVIQTVERWNEQTRSQQFLGIQVSRDIKARFDDSGTLERFLARLKTSENVTIGGVQAELASEQSLRNELRARAIEDSRAKATSIARSYDATLGPLYSVSDVAPEFAYGIREGQWPALYQWTQGGSGHTLDRIEVSGTRVGEGGESFHAGYITFESKLYAVFLLGDAD